MHTGAHGGADLWFIDAAPGAGPLARTHLLAVTLQAKSMFEPQRSSGLC